MASNPSSAASKFFLDASFAAFGQSSAGPGRTVTLAGFLLGTVSGSGVATTVTLGSVSWPVLRRAGYPQAQGGGVLAAAGIGAILSPPTLGAAAFIIAELLRESYLVVLVLATVPTLLYYLGIILAVELDARRFRTHPVAIEAPPLRGLLDSLTPGTVLDAACGSGRHSADLAARGHAVIGVGVLVLTSTLIRYRTTGSGARSRREGATSSRDG